MILQQESDSDRLSFKEEFEALINDILNLKSTKSLVGESCKILGLMITIFGTHTAASITFETGDRRYVLSTLACLGAGLPLSAIGSIATSNKKSANAASTQAYISFLNYTYLVGSIEN
jgi:hypothetical protein